MLIAGGMRRNQDFYKSAELYDPATGKFSATGEMNQRCFGQIAVLLRLGKVLIAGGGQMDNESLASAEIFRSKTLSVQPTGSMQHARVAHTATLLNDGHVLRDGRRAACRRLSEQRSGHRPSLDLQAVGPQR